MNMWVDEWRAAGGGWWVAGGGWRVAGVFDALSTSFFEDV